MAIKITTIANYRVSVMTNDSKTCIIALCEGFITSQVFSHTGKFRPLIQVAQDNQYTVSVDNME